MKTTLHPIKLRDQNLVSGKILDIDLSYQITRSEEKVIAEVDFGDILRFSEN